MKINLAENMLRFGVKNLSEQETEKVQNLGTISVTAKNTAGEKFAQANKGKSFGALPIYGKPGYFKTIPMSGQQPELVNLVVSDIMNNAPGRDAAYNPRTKQTTASEGSMILVLTSPGYVDDLRLSVNGDGTAEVVGIPKIKNVQLNMYDETGNTALFNGEGASGYVRDLNRLIEGVRQGVAYGVASDNNQMIAGAAAIVASTTDTKAGAGTKG